MKRNDLRRAAVLAAESLEPRFLLATTARLSADLSTFTRIPITFRKPDGSVGYSNTAHVGQLSWSGLTGDAAAAGVPASFRSFCIDGLQSVSGGRSTTFSGFTPAVSGSPLGTGPAMGGSRAGLLQSFWQQYGPADASGFADRTDAAAFQVAIWEIINDATPSGTRLTFDLASGQFSVAAAGRTLPAVARAAQWLTGFDSTAPARAAVVLYALQSPTAQDQIVPVPVVDLDVDSDNRNGLERSAFEDGIEEAGVVAGSSTAAGPGVIVPVGGERVAMVVDVPTGRTARLAFDAAAASRVRVLSATGEAVLTAGSLAAQVSGGGLRTFWIEAFAPSASIADIVFTLTTTDSGPSSSDTIRATAVAVDLDTDSNNDGSIDADNGPKGTDDPIEGERPGRVVFVNSDDDDRNGIADLDDIGQTVGENDLAEFVLTVSPATIPSGGTRVVTYDETIIRLYANTDRSGKVASGAIVPAGDRLYAEGRTSGSTLITISLAINSVQVSDVVAVTVVPYPSSMDVDIDSDNDNGFGLPKRSKWEEILEDHLYGIGKLIMLDNPTRPVTPIVLQVQAGLPMKTSSLGVRMDWDVVGLAGWVRLWNTPVIDEGRNSAAVSAGGNRIFPGFVYRLSDLRYETKDGSIIVYAEGVRENEQAKSLAGVESLPKLNEMIRATLVVNGDDAASDEVRYVVASEDSFLYQLQTRREVRNALAARGVYSFADMPKFGLQPKSRQDLSALGVPGNVIPDIGDGSTVAGFKSMLYQDYITGERQYVMAFAGTDDTFGQFVDQVWNGAEGDWQNNIIQGLGYGAPAQYEAAMRIGAALALNSAIPRGNIVATGHSLGGGLATAAAVVGGTQADTFNAAWLRAETLLEPDGFGGVKERYPETLTRFTEASAMVVAWYVDYEILNAVQSLYRLIGGATAPVGDLRVLDGPRDVDMAIGVAALEAAIVSGVGFLATAPSTVLVLRTMAQLHQADAVLYGLLVHEGRFGTVQMDTLGYRFSW